MERVLAMILAGGRGTRMEILCQGRPKPALPFAGKFRVIDFSLSNCYHSQIDNIAVLTDYQRSNIANYLRRWHLVNNSPKNFHILEPKNSSYKGTADAVYENLDYLERHGTDSLLVLAGDHVYKMDYRKMLTFHRRVKADVTVGVVSVPITQAHRFGCLSVGPEKRIVDFVEKPRLPQSNLVSMGIYLFSRDVLAKRLIADAPQPNSPHDFGYAILPRMVREDRVFAYEFKDYWQDIGTPESYYKANMDLARETPAFSLDGSWPVLTEDNSWLPSRKSAHAIVKNSIVSPGCVIKGHVENSVLSPGVCIEEEAIVKNSVLMSNVFVGYHSVVNSCVLDEGVNIGKFCFLGFGASPVPNGDVSVLGRSVAIPPHTAIGCKSKVLPNVTCADFTSRTVPQGAVIAPRSVSSPAEEVLDTRLKSYSL
ncbi:MAG: NTP transferase domain-containing protein [Chloroflexi bacterium]|nr:NTP transferase domain-containing protein [Chloroflexota bacterium]